MNNKKLQNIMKKVNQASHNYYYEPPNWTNSKKPKSGNITLTYDQSTIITRLSFSVKRNYIRQMKNILVSYPNRQGEYGRVFRHNMMWLRQQVRNALMTLPKFVHFFNIQIPVFYLENHTTDRFIYLLRDRSVLGDKHRGKSEKKNLKHCRHFIKLIRLAYSRPYNLVNLELEANFLLPISVNPVNAKYGQVAPRMLISRRADSIANAINSKLNYRL